MTILFNRGLVLAKIESVFDEDANPDATNDAFLVADPQFNPDITRLVRNNVRTSLSPDPHVIGRKIGVIQFQHEVRNNGNVDGTVAPRLGTLLRICGMEETQRLVGGISGLNSSGATSDALSFTIDNVQAAHVLLRRIRLLVTVGGPSGVATAQITSPGVSDVPEISLTDTDEVVLQDGVAITVHDTAGNPLFDLTPSFETDDPATGDVYTFDAAPIGYCYKPRSDGFESGTVYLYFPDDSGQSLLHRITGGRGTWTVEAVGGDFARFTFTITGSFQTVIDAATPASPVFETQKPRQVELAAMLLEDSGDFTSTLCASQFTMDIANDVQPRECINEPNSYQGSLIVDREPVMGFDPEAVLEAVHPFWGNLEAGAELEWRAKIGADKGNVVSFGAHIQYSDLGYQDRNSVRAYDVQAALSTRSGVGDDECEICFA